MQPNLQQNLHGRDIRQLHTSKLIDYAISGRPVLNIACETNLNLVDQFILGEYSQKLEISDISNYDIKVVTRQFLQLTSLV